MVYMYMSNVWTVFGLDTFYIYDTVITVYVHVYNTVTVFVPVQVHNTYTLNIEYVGYMLLVFVYMHYISLFLTHMLVELWYFGH